VLEVLSADLGVSVTTLVYVWLLQHPSSPVVLVGSCRFQVVQEAVAALDMTLSREHWFAIWSASNGNYVP